MAFLAGDVFDDEADESSRGGEECNNFLTVFVIDASQNEAFMLFFQWH